MSSDRAGAIKLVAEAGDPTVEIFLIGPDLELIDRATGRLEAGLRPGIYKVKFKMGTLGGSAEEEQFVALEAGKSPPVVTPRSRFDMASPMPIQGTSTTHEYHRHAAFDFSRKIHASLGQGSRLLVFVRDLDKGRTDNPLRRLTLHALDSDAVLADFEAVGEVIPEGLSGFQRGKHEIAAACNLDLAPGCYRLRIAGTPDGSYESAIVASGGWHTLVFLQRRSTVAAGGKEVSFADLQNASIQMMPVGVDFNPDSEHLRLTESARYALVERRERVGRGALRGMLEDKFDNPMLGFYGAHILMLSNEPNVPLVETIARNLGNLVGQDHPDLQALRLWLAGRAGKPAAGVRIEGAPMLMRSWHIIREAAAQNDEIVPEKSLLSYLGGWEMDNTMWLTWNAEAIARVRSGKAAMLAHTFTLAALASMFESTAGAVDNLLDRSGLDPVERELLARALRAIKSSQKSDAGGDGLPSILSIANSALRRVAKSDTGDVRGFIKGALENEDLIRQFGLPRSTVRRSVDSLLEKLG
jgi:hypothetical protein